VLQSPLLTSQQRLSCVSRGSQDATFNKLEGSRVECILSLDLPIVAFSPRDTRVARIDLRKPKLQGCSVNWALAPIQVANALVNSYLASGSILAGEAFLQTNLWFASLAVLGRE
jgi:hypothetical protein